MNPKRGVRDVEVDLRIGCDRADRANRVASEQDGHRRLDPMRSIYGGGGKGQRTTPHEVSATTRHGLDLGCGIAFERQCQNLERWCVSARRFTPGS